MGLFHHDKADSAPLPADEAEELAQENLPEASDLPETAIWQPNPGVLEENI